MKKKIPLSGNALSFREGLDTRALPSFDRLYFGGPKEAKPHECPILADLELHADGSLALDGITIQDNHREGDCVAFIPRECVVGFLENALKLHGQLKKKGLLPKPVKPTDKKEK